MEDRRPRTRDQVLQKYGRTVLTNEIDFLLNEALQKNSPHLKDEVCVYDRLEGDCKKYGDYLCTNILCVCELLRSIYPKLFEKIGPRIIAERIMRNFPRSEMIKELNIHDVGFLSFKLDGEWMAKRIHKNLQDGISAWAPIALPKRAIVEYPTRDLDPHLRVVHVQSSFIRDAIVNMLEYSGVEVSSTMHHLESLRVVKKCFPEDQGFIKNARKSESLFVVEGEAIRDCPNNVHADLAAIRCGIYVQKADWFVYVTPLRQREYIKQCFKVVEDCYEDEGFAGDRDFENEDHPTLCYVGYQTSSDERKKLEVLWEEFYKSVNELVLPAGCGYSPDDFFECAIKYEYLKKNRYSDCTFKIDELLSATGNTFLYLLNVQAILRSILKKFHSGDMFKSNKALVGREREMGLHLLQFTEIIEDSFLFFKPRLACEYVRKLSEDFISYSSEVQPSEISFLLCKATEVVMNKCFDLLGITPESFKDLSGYLKRQSGKAAIGNHYISWPISSRPNPASRLKSRFELFSMVVQVSHPKFESGNLFGYVTLSDTDALLADWWCNTDENDGGHIAYFDHDWHNSVGIYSVSMLSLGNPSSVRTVSFSSSIEICVFLHVTTKEKDACYQLCYCQEKIELSEFWDGDKSIKRGTFYAEGDNGSVSISYVGLKDAVDTYMSLSYEPTCGHPKVSGSILAYYGGDALDGCDGFNKHSFKAEIFHTESAILEKCNNLLLKKSTLAVPTNGSLVIEALFDDADSGEILVRKKRRFHVKAEGYSKWLIKGTKCSFNLILVWAPADKKPMNSADYFESVGVSTL